MKRRTIRGKDAPLKWLHTHLLGIWLSAPLALLAEDPSEFAAVRIETLRVRDGIYMLTGKGGNIGVCAGKEGVFLIDDQFAPLTDKIKKAVEAISDQPIRFLVNTHWHFDHTGGNEHFGRSDTLIMAHRNVRRRLV